MAKYKYSYHEERGNFDAHVEDINGKVIWEVHYPEFYEDSESGEMIENSTIFEDGFMKHVEDVDGLQKYLSDIGIIDADDEITMSEIEAEEEEQDDNLYEFVIPNWAMSALINGDFSGLSDEDEDKLNRFIEEVTAEYGNAWFMLPSDDKIDLGFKWRNDIDNLGSDCSLLYIRPSKDMDESKDFAGGGDTNGKIYYHVLEHGRYGEIGYHGYYETEKEANRAVKHLSDTFPNLYFDIFTSGDTNEPPIVTMDKGGDIKDYDDYDSEEDDDEDEGEANLNEISSETGIPVDVLKEYADSIGVDYDRLSDRDINYYGRYDSEEDFMESLVDEGVISGSALSGYLYMTNTDCRITAGEEADAYVENLDNSDLIDEADLENKLEELNDLVEKIEELENEIQEKTDEIEGLEDKLTQTEDEYDSESIKSDIEELREELKDLEDELVNARKDFDNLDYQDEDDIVDAAREIVRDKQYDYVYEKLDNDPTDYFVNELGAYTEEELAKSSFINIDYEKLARDFSSDYNIIEGEDGDIYVFTSYKKGGAIGSASVLRTAKKYVNEVNRLIALAYDEDGDPLVVYDTSSTWQSPSIYSPFKLSRGTLYGIEIDYPFGLGSKPTKKRIIVRKADLEFDGIGMLQDVAKMYRRALRQAGIQYKLDSDTKYSDGGMTLEEQNKQMLLGKTKEYQHHSRELQEIIAKNPMIPAWVIAKATRASTDISDITHYLDSLPVNLKKGGKLWIQGAIKREGALRKKAKEMGLIKGEEKLSMSDLNKLEALGGVWSKRANLAKTLRRFSEEKSKKKFELGAELENHNYFVDGGSISEEEEQISGESDKVKEISDVVDSLSEDVSEENTELPTKFIGEYKFNVASISALNKAIETIKKMSKKFGIKPPEIIIGEPRLVGIDYDEIWGEYKYKVDLTPVTIKVENIFKLQEYDVLGVVDNATGGSVKFSDEKIPNEYLNPSEVCDLCKTNRRRGKTWVVKKIGTGEYFRFGSDCVKRVFGINPMTYIRALDYFRKLNDIFSEFDEEGYERGGEKKRISPKMRVIPFDIALTVVKEAFDKVGYVKKLWEEEQIAYGRYEKYRINEGQATADIIENKLLDEKYAHSVIPNTEFLNNFKGFWQSLEVSNNTKFDEFLNKIKKQVIDEEFRIIDSGMFSFAMHYMAQAKKQAERKPSNYVGVVGEKYDFVNLKVTDKRVFDSQFGTNTLWTFVDENENVIKKFGELDLSFYVGSESGEDARLKYYFENSTEQEVLRDFFNNYVPKVGDLFSFTAPIKKHEEYRGVKSTLIGRTSKTKPPKKKKLEDGDELEYAKGGGTKRKDLFETPEKMPKKVAVIIDRYQEEMGGDMNYEDMANMLREVESVGYTFDYYLDNEPYGLRPIGVNINELEGFEEMAKGGLISDKERKEIIKKLISDRKNELSIFRQPVNIIKNSLGNPQISVGVKPYQSWEKTKEPTFVIVYGRYLDLSMLVYDSYKKDKEFIEVVGKEKAIKVLNDILDSIEKSKTLKKIAKGSHLDYKKPVFEVEFSWDKVTEDDFDSRKVNVNAESVSDAENVVREKFGKSYKNLKIIQIERVMAKGGDTNQYVAGYIDLSKVEPSFVNDSALDTLPVIDIVKKDVIENVEKPISSSYEIVQLAKKHYGDAINTYEKLVAIMLNRANKPIYIYDHSKGSITGTVADPQLILAAANKTLAKGIILIHNHPSGNLTPSAQDDDLTKKLGQACKYFDITLLDHIILTKNGYYSYANEGRALYERGGVSGMGAEINEGKVENQYLKFKNAADLWDNGWSFAQRLSFIEDHRLEIEKRYGRKVGSEYKMKDYLYLPAYLQQAIRSHFMEGQYSNGGEVEDLDNLTDDLLATKIRIFLEKVKPYRNYWLDDKEDILYVYFDTESPIDQYEKAYKEATASMEFFDADGVEITHPKDGSTKMVIPLKKNVIFKYKDYSKDYLVE